MSGRLPKGPTVFGRLGAWVPSWGSKCSERSGDSAGCVSCRSSFAWVYWTSFGTSIIERQTGHRPLFPANSSRTLKRLPQVLHPMLIMMTSQALSARPGWRPRPESTLSGLSLLDKRPILGRLVHRQPRGRKGNIPISFGARFAHSIASLLSLFPIRVEVRSPQSPGCRREPPPQARIAAIRCRLGQGRRTWDL